MALKAIPLLFKFLGRSVKPEPTLTLSPVTQGVSPSTSQFLGRAGLYQDQLLFLVSQQPIELTWDETCISPRYTQSPTSRRRGMDPVQSDPNLLAVDFIPKCSVPWAWGRNARTTPLRVRCQEIPRHATLVP